MAGSRLRHINGYLLKADDGYVLVDCGWDTDDVLEALRGELHALGIGLEDVRTLVISHFHSDHYGLAGRLVRLGRLRLMMHRLDWLHVHTNLADPIQSAHVSHEWLLRHGLPEQVWGVEEQRALESFHRFTVVEPDLKLEDAARIAVGPHELQVVWTPGHTQGHICLYDPGRRLLLSGDHVLDPITPNVSYARPGLGNPLGAFLASLRKVAELDADLVLPAHGEPFRGLRRRVDELLEHHAEREAQAVDALSATEPLRAVAVAEQLPWTRRGLRYAELEPLQQRMALAETIAHLEELKAIGRVASIERDGGIYYRSVPATERLPAAATG